MESCCQRLVFRDEKKKKGSVHHGQKFKRYHQRIPRTWNRKNDGAGITACFRYVRRHCSGSHSHGSQRFCYPLLRRHRNPPVPPNHQKQGTHFPRLLFRISGGLRNRRPYADRCQRRCDSQFGNAPVRLGRRCLRRRRLRASCHLNQNIWH